MTEKTPAYGARAAKGPVAPLTIERRDPGPNDVAIEILYCGICHSDIHSARGEWGGATYPMVPGHEQCAARLSPDGVLDPEAARRVLGAKTAALVTPDRALARRVAAALDRYELGVRGARHAGIAQDSPGDGGPRAGARAALDSREEVVSTE